MASMKSTTAMKFVIIFLMMNTVYSLIYDLLVIIGRTSFEVMQGQTIFISFFGVFVACILIKNMYWILAFVFTGCRTMAEIVASKYLEKTNDVSSLSHASIIIIVIGMVCLMLSLFFFYRLLQTKDFLSKKYAYTWMMNLDVYIKKKMHGSK